MKQTGLSPTVISSTVFGPAVFPAIGAIVMAALYSTAASAQLVEYQAEYGARYKSRNVGTSVFALQRGADNNAWIFSTTMQAKGLLRFASPRPIIDRSEFTLEHDTIVPQRFLHEDGSRKGEDNHNIVFDWGSQVAVISGEGYSREVALQRGVLDRGSLQVALMHTLAAGRQPQSFSVLDEQSVDDYEYTFEGEHTIETELGDVAVLRYRQQRTGSSRYTVIDLAPALDYVPVRIEQIRDGETRSAFLIESIEQP